jgi:putative glutamine amidotransferase
VRVLLTLDRDADPRENDYVRALLRQGIAPEEILVLAPGTSPPADFDALLLGGGIDVDPKRYGQMPRASAGLELDAERDATDFAALESARASGKPVLGICRGLQVVNVGLGGTLVQDIPLERPSEVPHQHPKTEKTRRAHRVRLEPGTLLRDIAGVAEIEVNSRHHQAVADAAPGLRVSAASPDGLVEGLESTGEDWLVAVQWHPENLAGDPSSEALFAEFVRAARRAGDRGDPR